jgi:uncharacterized protein
VNALITLLMKNAIFTTRNPVVNIALFTMCVNEASVDASQGAASTLSNHRNEIRGREMRALSYAVASAGASKRSRPTRHAIAATNGRDETLVAEIRRSHAAHTIILYGSRARGDATPDSDIDVAAFAEVATTMRDARHWHGLYLDGFVYPTAVATSPTLDPEMLNLADGRVLLDERGLAGALLDRVAAMDREPPPAAPADHCQMLRTWARKMLPRIKRGDIEAHYRRHWLLYQLLEDYYTLRGERYPGPKLALAALRRDRPATFFAFEGALAPGAPHEALEALVDAVVG